MQFLYIYVTLNKSSLAYVSLNNILLYEMHYERRALFPHNMWNMACEFNNVGIDL